MSSARRNDLAMVVIGALVIILDQLTKHWVVQYFASGTPQPPIELVGQVLTIDYVQNTGVAFSLLEGQTVMFVFIGVAIAVIGTLYWRTREKGSLPLKLTFGLILGGAIGNLVDRVAHQYVVDFIHFQIPGIFNFAVFNVADSAITIGVFMLAYLLWRGTPGTEAVPEKTLQTSEAATPDRAPQNVVRGK